ncbi:hypothetical protein [Rhodococcus daqingensis]|uniref:Ig-like domain-containing protein n=1 Tax=Rhodococcus daqingensis TaxID=2479363 RepID=A0ABW2RRD1_9NOCA
MRTTSWSMVPVLAGAAVALALGLLVPGAAAAPSVPPPDTTTPDGSGQDEGSGQGSGSGSGGGSYPRPALTLDSSSAFVDDSVGAYITCPGDNRMSSMVVTMEPSGTVVLVTGSSEQLSGREWALDGSLTVPEVEPGEYTLVTACGGQAPFTVRAVQLDPSLTVSPDHGPPGENVEFHGTDLPRCRGTWSVTLGGTVLGNVEQDGDTLEHTATVPTRATPGSRLARIECASPDASAEAGFEVEQAAGVTTTTTTRSTVPTTATTTRRIQTTDPPSTTTVGNGGSGTGSPPVALIAAAGLTSVAVAAGAGVAVRARQARRWLTEHVDTQPRPAPPVIAVEPPPGQVHGHSVRLEPRGDAGHQIIEENGRDEN